MEIGRMPIICTRDCFRVLEHLGVSEMIGTLQCVCNRGALQTYSHHRHLRQCVQQDGINLSFC